MNHEPELVVDAHADVGEGPAWDHETSTMLFVDVSPGIIYRHEPSTGTTTETTVGQEIGAAIPRAAGGLVVAIRDGIALMDDDDHLQFIAEIEGDNPGNRMNDAKCDPTGRLWAGTMAFDFAEDAAALYRIEADHRYERVVAPTTISNGLGWSPDGSTMYFIDSGTSRVDAFDYDLATGTPSNRRPLVEFTQDDGMPDGMTVDADGNLWVALFGGGAVRTYSPAGEALHETKLPVSQVTSCAFGGDDLSDLYITTAAYELTPEQLAEQPHAGGMFRCRPGVRGQATVPYGG